MKILIPILILGLTGIAQHQASAKDPFAGSAVVSVIGTYAGVMIPVQSADADTEITEEDVQRTDALGLFNLSVPETGFASGEAIIFSRGRVFQGGINGFADPDGGEVFAVITTRFDFTLTTVEGTTVVTREGTATAEGVLTAQIKAPVFDRTSLSNSTRITGTASLDFSDGFVDEEGAKIITNTVEFLVSGVQQSFAPTDSGVVIGD